MITILLFVAITFIACAQAVPVIEPRIVEGDVAYLAQFPYMASLTDREGHKCGGAIIDEKWILTAAHCVDFYKKPSDIWVHVGMNDLDKASSRYDVEKIVVHKDWNVINISNDIAMLKLVKNVKFSDKVQKINFANTDIPAGNKAVLSGWGITKFPSEIASNKLKFLNLHIVALNKCMVDHLPSQIHGSNICAKPVTIGGACTGDSGSPMVHNNEVAGIASWVQPCGVGYPDVYTKVSFFHKWIVNNIATK